MSCSFSIRKEDSGYSFGFQDTERYLSTHLTRFEMAALHEMISIALSQPPIFMVSMRIANAHAGDGS